MKRLIATLILALFFALPVIASAVSVNGGTFTATRTAVGIDSTGNMLVTMSYTVTASGRQIHVRTLLVPASGGAITDNFGNVVAASVPGALSTALTSFLSQLDSTISTGAGQGKLDL